MNTLTIRGTGTAANYEFSVGGTLETDEQSGLENGVHVCGKAATGEVTTSDHVDRYRFTGSVTDFTFLEGEAEVELNGEPVDPRELVSATSQPNELTIEGTGTETEYSFTVESNLEANPERGGSKQWESLEGNTASSWVTDPSHVDSYRFDGELVDFTLHEGEATVELNGEPIDPGEW